MAILGAAGNVTLEGEVDDMENYGTLEIRKYSYASSYAPLRLSCLMIIRSIISDVQKHDAQNS